MRIRCRRGFPRLFALLVLAFAARSSGAETAEADSAPFVGTWLGVAKAPNAETAIGFAFERTARGVRTRFYMPAMFLTGAAFGPAEIAGGELTFAPLDTVLHREGDRLVGRFGLGRLPVELRRVDAFPAVAPLPEISPGPKPTWTTRLGATVWSSPVARGDSIFVAAVDGRLHALRAQDGHKRWEWTGPNALYGTPLVTANRLYLVDDAFDLLCVDQSSGKLVWRTSLYDERAAQVPRPKNETFTHRTPTPAIAGGTLYVGSSDGAVYAVSADTGQVEWRENIGTKVYATITINDGNLLIGGFDGTVLILDRQTRKQIARTKLPGPVVSAPVASGDTVIVGCRDYMLYGLRTRDLSTSWQYSFWFSWVESTPALVDGMLYIGGSDFARISALNPATSQPQWTAVVRGLTWGTPLVTADRVYAGTAAQADAIIAHEAGLVAIDRRSGAVEWRTKSLSVKAQTARVLSVRQRRPAVPR